MSTESLAFVLLIVGLAGCTKAIPIKAEPAVVAGPPATALALSCPVAAKVGQPLVFKIFSGNPSDDLPHGIWRLRDINGTPNLAHTATMASEFHIGFSEPGPKVISYELNGERAECTVRVEAK